MIILVKHMYEWRGYDLVNSGIGVGRGKETISHPDGLSAAIARGAKIVEAVGVEDVSRFGCSSECHYARYRVDFPDELIAPLLAGDFKGLETMVPIPL